MQHLQGPEQYDAEKAEVGFEERVGQSTGICIVRLAEKDRLSQGHQRSR